MPEIIPNWHPFLVHFTVALFFTSTGLFFLGIVFSKSKFAESFLKVAKINLWLGAVFTIFTFIAGWVAYSSVEYTAVSEEPLTNHSIWATATACLFWLLAMWSLVCKFKVKAVRFIFLGFMILASVLLSLTTYKGTELVYRYQLGVLPLDAQNHQEKISPPVRAYKESGGHAHIDKEP